jgi:hypothetical protein
VASGVEYRSVRISPKSPKAETDERVAVDERRRRRRLLDVMMVEKMCLREGERIVGEGELREVVKEEQPVFGLRMEASPSLSLRSSSFC